MTAHPEPRSRAERMSDTLARLRGPVADCWVASASAAGGEPYLVPLTMAWLQDRIVLASDGTSRTATNLATTGRARLSLGTTRDVVLIDAELEETFAVADAPAWVAEGYAAVTDWDPRTAGGSYVYLVLRPTRIQAWREENEIPGRTLMRDAAWLT